MYTTRQILVVDDDEDIGEFISTVAQSMNFRCTVTTNAWDFLLVLDQAGDDVALIFLDLMMPEMDGIELLRLLERRQCRADIILISGVSKRVLETATELAHTLGLAVAGHLQKPFRLAEVEALLCQQPSLIAPAHAAGSAQPEIRDQDLCGALEREEFVVYYQPQIELQDDRVAGVEALVRWQHPQLGLVGPDAFIVRLERLGKIDELGMLVANRALADLNQLGQQYGALELSLNVSPLTLHNLKFPDQLVAMAQHHRVSPSKLTVEITESGLIRELSTALDILTRLRMKNVNLSIDDFGTGYAMMQQLQHIPATELKIDKSFVNEMLCNDTARIIVQKTIEMGHALGMSVIAEGVETAEQLAFLRLNQCDRSQGYLHSRPLPLSALLEWLRARTQAGNHAAPAAQK